jgi:hypothetical protein
MEQVAGGRRQLEGAGRAFRGWIFFFWRRDEMPFNAEDAKER